MRTCRSAGSWGLWIALVGAPLLVPLLNRSASALESSDDAVACPRCAQEGKVTCKRCGGIGKITRECRRCGGTGQRPCLQCNRPGEDREIPAGQVACDYCGGKGTLGKQGSKPCPECGGSAIVTCPSCSGAP